MNIFCPGPCVCPPNPVGTGGIFPDPNAEANPFSNFSSEKPDANIFVGNNTTNGGFNPNGPPLGPWTATGCVGLCVSTVSQQAADYCAANQTVLCKNDDQPKNFCDLFPTSTLCQPEQPPQPPQPQTVYYNEAQQCSYDCGDGNSSIISIPAGTFAALSLVLANDIARSEACRLVRAASLCLGSLSQTTVCLGSPFSGIIIAQDHSEGVVDVTFAILGTLPPGLTMTKLSGTSVQISGTPTVGGVFTFSIRAFSTTGPTIEKQYTISIPGITTPSPLPAATSGAAYSQFLSSTSFFTGTRTWAVTSGGLPPGMALSATTGEISGTPTDATTTTYNFVVTLTDDASVCSKAFALQVNLAACADWTTLVWGPPNETTFGAGTTTVAAFQNQVTVLSCGSPNGDSDAAIADITGTLSYNGPGCNCNLHLEMTNAGDPNFVNGGVQITVNGVIVIVSPQFQTFGPAIIDQPFSLPNTGGVAIPISVLATGDSGEAGDPNLNSFGLFAEITNVP